MANTLIVGAGWLGTPLAQALLVEGHDVVITRRSQARLDERPSTIANAALLDLNDENAAQNWMK